MGGWVGWGGVGGYDQLCCPASPKLLLGLDLGLGCDKIPKQLSQTPDKIHDLKNTVSFCPEMAVVCLTQPDLLYHLIVQV